jgi:hypothetical protein
MIETVRPSQRGRRPWVAQWFCLFFLPGFALAQPSAFEGTWSGVFTTQDHEYWQVEDFSCFAGCPLPAYRYMQGLLDDPANDDRPLEEITGETMRFARRYLEERSTPEGLAQLDMPIPANDPSDRTLACSPYGFVRQSTNPLPLIIRREGEHLVIDYEEWSLSRTIYMDGRGHPDDLVSSPLGYSVGRYEDDDLVVETKGLTPDFLFIGGGRHSGEAKGTERYSLDENPRRLQLELTIEDPVMLRGPYVLTKTWLHTPEVELLEDSCEDLPAQPDFEGIG